MKPLNRLSLRLFAAVGLMFPVGLAAQGGSGAQMPGRPTSR